MIVLEKLCLFLPPIVILLGDPSGSLEGSLVMLESMEKGGECSSGTMSAEEGSVLLQNEPVEAIPARPLLLCSRSKLQKPEGQCGEKGHDRG